MSASPHETIHLGVVAYVWGALHQDRLLLECLAPAIAELRRQELVHRFWFDRHDARGPHVFALLTLPRERASEVSGQLAARLGEHLAAHPSTTVLTSEQLDRRHAETRKKRQCAVDGWSGLAANNSFEIFEHPPRGYPFRLSEGLAGEAELWNRVTGLTLWTINRLGARPGVPAMAVAVRWAASVHRELRLAGAAPEAYWLHYATALLPDLFQGMGPDERAAALSELAGDAERANPAYVQAWKDVADTGPVWPGLPELMRLILDGSSALPSPWPLLREVHHVAVKQLGIPGAFHLPMALDAWRRSVAERKGEAIQKQK